MPFAIKPGVCRHPKMLACSMAARLLFFGMWGLAEKGVVDRTALELKAEIFPVDDVDIWALLGDLVKAGLIRVQDEPLRYILDELPAERRVKVVKVPAATPERAELIRLVFADYLRILEKSQSMKLDDKRKVLIGRALDNGYTAEDLAKCFTGYTYSTFHMGDNKDNRRYDSIDLFLRDAKRIDQGIEYWESRHGHKVQRSPSTRDDDIFDPLQGPRGNESTASPGAGQKGGKKDPGNPAAGAYAGKQPQAGPGSSDELPWD